MIVRIKILRKVLNNLKMNFQKFSEILVSDWKKTIMFPSI